MKWKRYSFRYRETVTTLLAENDEVYSQAVKAILEARAQVERAIAENPMFYISLEPLNAEFESEVASRMCKAARLAGVGPMAAVAGGIAQYAVERVDGRIVIDNGGDVVMRCREITVGIFPTKLGVKLEFDRERVYSVCTSSGRYGHSISFGDCDAAVVLAEDGFIADAFATALGNEIKSGFGRAEIEDAMESFWKRVKNYVDGIVVVKDNYIGFAGNVEIVKADYDERLITR